MQRDLAIPIVAIIDDDESVRDSINSLMRSAGYRTAVFASADAFLTSEYAGDEDDTILLLDLHMPGLNGLELQRRLAELKCSIPIIFITAHADDRDRAKAVREGAFAFIAKPFSDTAVLGAIRSALQSPNHKDAR